MVQYFACPSVRSPLSKQAFLLLKCVARRLWENSQFVIKQCEGIGNVGCQALARAGLDSFAKLSDASPSFIESICGRRPPFGKEIRDIAQSILHVGLKVETTMEAVIITVNLQNPGTARTLSIEKEKTRYRLFVTSDMKLVSSRIIDCQSLLQNGGNTTIVVPFRNAHQLNEKLTISAIHAYYGT